MREVWRLLFGRIHRTWFVDSIEGGGVRRTRRIVHKLSTSATPFTQVFSVSTPGLVVVFVSYVYVLLGHCGARSPAEAIQRFEENRRASNSVRPRRRRARVGRLLFCQTTCLELCSRAPVGTWIPYRTGQRARAPRGKTAVVGFQCSDWLPEEFGTRIRGGSDTTPHLTEFQLCQRPRLRFSSRTVELLSGRPRRPKP